MMAYVDSDPSIHSRNDPAPGERPAFSDLLDRLIREAEQQSRPADAAPDTPTDAPAYAPASAPTENGMPGNAPSADAPSGSAPSGSTAASAPPIGNGLLGSLLSNPHALQAIPALMSSLGPLLSSLSASRPTGTAIPAGDAPTGAVPTGAAPTGAAPAGSAPAGGHPAKKGAPNRHTALLCAIKPYLGSERRQAVESMVQLLKVFDAVQDMGQLLPTPQKPSAHDGKEET